MPNPASLVNILHRYVQGEEIEDIRHALKKTCKPIGGISAYESIQSAAPTDNQIITDVLNALSIGGAQLHCMTTTMAISHQYFNCYVWTPQQGLFYIDKTGASSPCLSLLDETLLSDLLDNLNRAAHPATLETHHLTADQIRTYITENTAEAHIPPTTNYNRIQWYKNSPNLYIALTRIKTDHRHLEHFVELIQDTKPERSWLLYLTLSAGSAMVAGLLYYLNEQFDLIKAWFERTMPLTLQWLSKTINILRNMPLIGIFSNGIPLLYAWYQMLFIQPPSEDWDPSITLFFKTIEHGFPIIGYVLCYLAAGAMTFPAVTMFVTGAGIEIIHALYTVIHDELARRNNPIAPGTEYYSHTAAARDQQLHERGVWMSAVKFLSNTILTVFVVIWCVNPPNLIISVGCVIGAWLVDLIKNTTLSHIKTTYANRLQAQIKQLNERYYPEQPSHVALSNATMRTMEQELRDLQQQAQTIPEQLATAHMEGYRKRYHNGYKDGATRQQKGLTGKTLVRETTDGLKQNSLWKSVNASKVRTLTDQKKATPSNEGYNDEEYKDNDRSHRKPSGRR